jgi:DNA mismatch endonuclease (patch repair protein)
MALLRNARITGWRRHQKLPGCPDFVFRRERVAVFVDGCFWHGCRWHCRMPEDNNEYWQRKISRNMARDRATTEALKASGWRVLRVWGHALRHPDRILIRITSVLNNSSGRRNNAAGIK